MVSPAEAAPERPTRTTIEDFTAIVDAMLEHYVGAPDLESATLVSWWKLLKHLETRELVEAAAWWMRSQRTFPNAAADIGRAVRAVRNEAEQRKKDEEERAARAKHEEQCSLPDERRMLPVVVGRKVRERMTELRRQHPTVPWGDLFDQEWARVMKEETAALEARASERGEIGGE